MVDCRFTFGVANFSRYFQMLQVEEEIAWEKFERDIEKGDLDLVTEFCSHNQIGGYKDAYGNNVLGLSCTTKLHSLILAFYGHIELVKFFCKVLSTNK